MTGRIPIVLATNLNDATYTPVRLLNEAAYLLKAKSLHHLADLLDVDGGQLWRIRNRKASVSHSLIINIMDRTGWSLTQVRELAGLPFIERDSR